MIAVVSDLCKSVRLKKVEIGKVSATDAVLVCEGGSKTLCDSR